MEERNKKNAANDTPQVDALADLPLTGEQAEDAKAGVRDGVAEEYFTHKFKDVL